MRYRELFVLLCASVLASAGCSSHKIVRAAPPSVISPPEAEKPPTPEPVPPVVVETTPEPGPELPPEAPPPAPAKPPAPRPRPAQPDSASLPPKPAAPQISPQLSAKDLAAAQSNTTSSITIAEKNMQASTGKQLNAAQNDLVGKITAFLGQAHEAILADDWVQAENLAEKARVLSLELVNSF